MVTQSESCPIFVKGSLFDITASEKRAIRRFKSGDIRVDGGAMIMTQGNPASRVFTVLKGMGLRYRKLPNGDRLAINFIFPGDVVGLQADMMGKMHYSVEATTEMTLCVFDRAKFFDLFQLNATRAFQITWHTAADEHFLSDALAIGRQRTAREAVAWALLKLFKRGRALGLVEAGQMQLPFRQQDLADALGLSLVHTNKTLAKLRNMQLASWSNGTLHVSDLVGLAEVAKTDMLPAA